MHTQMSGQYSGFFSILSRKFWSALACRHWTMTERNSFLITARQTGRSGSNTFAQKIAWCLTGEASHYFTASTYLHRAYGFRKELGWKCGITVWLQLLACRRKGWPCMILVLSNICLCMLLCAAERTMKTIMLSMNHLQQRPILALPLRMTATITMAPPREQGRLEAVKSDPQTFL